MLLRVKDMYLLCLLLVTEVVDTGVACQVCFWKMQMYECESMCYTNDNRIMFSIEMDVLGKRREKGEKREEREYTQGIHVYIKKMQQQ